MSILRRALDTRQVTRSWTATYGNPWVIPTNSAPSFTSAGVQVTEDTAMQLLAVHACVRILSGTLSGMPLNCVRTGPDGHQQRMIPAPRIIADPFGGQNALSGRFLTRKQGISQMIVSLLLRGNAFCWATQLDRMMRPTGLQVLHPDVVGVDIDDKTGERHYTIQNEPVPSARIVHVTGLTQPGSPLGISVIGSAQRAISLGIAAEEFGARFFGSGAHLSGVIETEADMDPDKARQLAEAFQASHTGMAKAHKVGVLTGGAKWAPISVTPEDAQFLGTRSAQNLDIAMLFGIPPHMLGQVDRTTSWGRGIEEQTLGFLKYTLKDWGDRVEDAFSAMTPSGWFARFDYDELLRPDSTNRWATYQVARNTGAMTVNEIRSREGLPKLPGDLGDDPFAPLNSAHANDPGWTPDGEEPAGEPAPLQAAPTPGVGAQPQKVQPPKAKTAAA